MIGSPKTNPKIIDAIIVVVNKELAESSCFLSTMAGMKLASAGVKNCVAQETKKAIAYIPINELSKNGINPINIALAIFDIIKILFLFHLSTKTPAIAVSKIAGIVKATYSQL